MKNSLLATVLITFLPLTGCNSGFQVTDEFLTEDQIPLPSEEPLDEDLVKQIESPHGRLENINVRYGMSFYGLSFTYEPGLKILATIEPSNPSPPTTSLGSGMRSLSFRATGSDFDQATRIFLAYPNSSRVINVGFCSPMLEEEFPVCTLHLFHFHNMQHTCGSGNNLYFRSAVSPGPKNLVVEFEDGRVLSETIWFKDPCDSFWASTDRANPSGPDNKYAPRQIASVPATPRNTPLKQSILLLLGLGLGVGATLVGTRLLAKKGK